MKTTTKVFLLLGTLVACFLVWQLVFNEGGILKTGYNSVVDGINRQYEKVAGAGETLLPRWDDTDATEDANGTAFDIDVTG